MYRIIEGKVTIENESHIVYGIYFNDEYQISDVSPDKEAVLLLIENFNRYGLAPYQLYDAVSDAIDL
jgi:hypothetical protein